MPTAQLGRTLSSPDRMPIYYGDPKAIAGGSFFIAEAFFHRARLSPIGGCCRRARASNRMPTIRFWRVCGFRSDFWRRPFARRSASMRENQIFACLGDDFCLKCAIAIIGRRRRMKPNGNRSPQTDVRRKSAWLSNGQKTLLALCARLARRDRSGAIIVAWHRRQIGA